MSKICKIILSVDVFTTKQNLGKHSTVYWFNYFSNSKLDIFLFQEVNGIQIALFVPPATSHLSMATFSSMKTSRIVKRISMPSKALCVLDVPSPFQAVVLLQCFANFILNILSVRFAWNSSIRALLRRKERNLIAMNALIGCLAKNVLKISTLPVHSKIKKHANFFGYSFCFFPFRVYA